MQEKLGYPELTPDEVAMLKTPAPPMREAEEDEQVRDREDMDREQADDRS